MARAMWKGAIQFGLVTIPVKLYTATEASKTISFHMLHKQDLTRIQMKVYCPTDEEIVERRDTVRGYEYAPDQYVVITDEDLESVPLKTVRTMKTQLTSIGNTAKGVSALLDQMREMIIARVVEAEAELRAVGATPRAG